MNNWSGTGNLVKDPETRTTESGATICKFTVACRRKYKKEGQPDSDFIRCVAFNKTGEFVSRHFSKGKNIAICGSIQTNNWKDEGGAWHNITEILVDNVDFCGSKSDSAPSAQSTPARSSSYPNKNMASAVYDLESEESLPF